MCECVHAYLCVCVCMRACMCAWVCVGVRVCVCVCTCILVCMCVHACMHVCACVHVCALVCACVVSDVSRSLYAVGMYMCVIFNIIYQTDSIPQAPTRSEAHLHILMHMCMELCLCVVRSLKWAHSSGLESIPSQEEEAGAAKEGTGWHVCPH